MRITLIAAALAITGLTAIGPAHADDWSKVPQLDVPYGDLNLAHSAGAKTMLRRIKSAAPRVCGGKPAHYYFKAVVRFRQCVHTATDGAVAKLNAPLVTALHTGRPVTDPRLAQDGTK